MLTSVFYRPPFYWRSCRACDITIHRSACQKKHEILVNQYVDMFCHLLSLKPLFLRRMGLCRSWMPMLVCISSHLCMDSLNPTLETIGSCLDCIFLIFGKLLCIYLFCSPPPGNTLHWQRKKRPEQQTPYLFSPRAPSAELELTATVLKAMVYGENSSTVSTKDLNEMAKISNWLVQQQNIHGSYSTTSVRFLFLGECSRIFHTPFSYGPDCVL